MGNRILHDEKPNFDYRGKEKVSNSTAIILAPRDNGYRIGHCDVYGCMRHSWLKPLFNKDGTVGAYICADSNCDEASNDPGG